MRRVVRFLSFPVGVLNARSVVLATMIVGSDVKNLAYTNKHKIVLLLFFFFGGDRETVFYVSTYSYFIFTNF